jgi:hypothetical protein
MSQSFADSHSLYVKTTDSQTFYAILFILISRTIVSIILNSHGLPSYSSYLLTPFYSLTLPCRPKKGYTPKGWNPFHCSRNQNVQYTYSSLYSTYFLVLIILTLTPHTLHYPHHCSVGRCILEDSSRAAFTRAASFCRLYTLQPRPAK